jgi:hypothetical protein
MIGLISFSYLVAEPRDNSSYSRRRWGSKSKSYLLADNSSYSPRRSELTFSRHALLLPFLFIWGLQDLTSLVHEVVPICIVTGIRLTTCLPFIRSAGRFLGGDELVCHLISGTLHSLLFYSQISSNLHASLAFCGWFLYQSWRMARGTYYNNLIESFDTEICFLMFLELISLITG